MRAWLQIVNKYSRELLGIELVRSITAEDVVRALERLVRERAPPSLSARTTAPSSWPGQ